MAWEFATDPEFEAQLEWIDAGRGRELVEERLDREHVEMGAERAE